MQSGTDALMCNGARNSHEPETRPTNLRTLWGVERPMGNRFNPVELIPRTYVEPTVSMMHGRSGQPAAAAATTVELPSRTSSSPSARGVTRTGDRLERAPAAASAIRVIAEAIPSGLALPCLAVTYRPLIALRKLPLLRPLLIIVLHAAATTIHRREQVYARLTTDPVVCIDAILIEYVV